MPSQNYRRRLWPLLLYLCDIFQALIHSPVCWFLVYGLLFLCIACVLLYILGDFAVSFTDIVSDHSQFWMVMLVAEWSAGYLFTPNSLAVRHTGIFHLVNCENNVELTSTLNRLYLTDFFLCQSELTICLLCFWSVSHVTFPTLTCIIHTCNLTIRIYS